MINSCLLPKRRSTVGGSWCFAYWTSAMASREWELLSDDDPWRVSAFISAVMELFLSILLLLGAAIAFITSRFVKFFGLEPPCTYIGCGHPLHSESTRVQRYSVPPLCKSKEFCVDELCSDCHPFRTYSKLQSKEFSFIDDCCDDQNGCHDEDACQLSGRDDSSSRDPNTTQSDVDVCGHHLDSSRRDHHEGHHVCCDHRNSDCLCSCCNSPLYRRLNRRKYVKQKTFVAAAATGNLFNKDNLPLSSAKSVSEISGNSDAEDHCETSSISADSSKKFGLRKEECEQKRRCIDDDDDASTYSGEALSRDTDDESPHVRLEGVNEEIYKIPSHPSGNTQAESAQPSSQFVLEDDFEVSKVLTNNPHHFVDNGANLAFLKNQGPSETNQSAQEAAQGKGIEDGSNLIGSGVWNPFFRPGEVQNAEVLEGLLEALPVGKSLIECNRLDVYDGHNIGLSAYEEKADQRQDFENIELPDSDGMVVLGEVGRGSPFESGKNIEGFLELYLLKNNEEVKVEGSVVEMKSEEMALEGHGDTGQIQGIETSETQSEFREEETSKKELRQDLASVYDSESQEEGCGQPPIEESVAQEGDGWFWDLSQDRQLLKEQSMLQEVILDQEVLDLQIQEDGFGEYFKDECGSKTNPVQDVQLLDDQQHLHELSEPARTYIKSDDADGFTGGSDADDAKEGDKELVMFMVADLQGTHGGNLRLEEVEGTETEGQYVGDFISETPLEPINQVTLDQQPIEGEGSSGKDLVASSAALFEEVNIQQGSIGGVIKACSEGVDTPCQDEKCLEGVDAPCEKDEKSSNLEQGEVAIKDIFKRTEGNGLDDINATERQEEGSVPLVSTNDIIGNADQSSCVREIQRGQQERLSKLVEGMGPPVPPSEAEQEEEETVLEEHQEEGLDALKEALEAERTILTALEAELENERNAAAIATSEAMAMISRLQDEKSAMQMEVAQLQRMSEEKADYDEQAMALLKEILFKREKENFALEKEVELYRRLIAQKADEVKRSMYRKENGGLSMQSPKPMLLLRGIDEEEDTLSPEVGSNRLKALPSLEEAYQPETKSAPQLLRNMALEDGFGLSPHTAEPKTSKRLRDSPLGDKMGVGLPPKILEDAQKRGDLLDGELHGLCNIYQQHREVGRSIFSTDDEETQFILERLWALEEELQELRGKDELDTPKHFSKLHEANNSHADPWGVQCVVGDKSKGQRKEVEMDGAAGGFLPVHDVYEVQAAPKHFPPGVEESNTFGGFEGMLLSSGNISQDFMAARMHKHMPLVPPKLPQARRLFSSKEIESDSPPFASQAAGWIVEDFPYAEDSWEHHTTHSHSLVSREEKHVEAEEVQQLAVRLKALEADRELLRETTESFKHRDGERELLQEIAQHLRELRMVSFKRVSADGLSQDSSSTSSGKSCARALKKRRYCSGLGQTQLLLLQHKSI